MSEHKCLEVIESDIRNAADFARRKGYVASTIARILDGRANGEILVQSFARYRLELSLLDKYEPNFIDKRKIESLEAELAGRLKVISKIDRMLSDVMWFPGKKRIVGYLKSVLKYPA